MISLHREATVSRRGLSVGLLRLDQSVAQRSVDLRSRIEAGHFYIGSSTLGVQLQLGRARSLLVFGWGICTVPVRLAMI